MRAGDAVALAVSIALVVLSTASYTGVPPASLSIVAGYSMYPALKPGDLAVGVNARLFGFAPGDIVVYCRGLTPCVIHRVVSVANGTVVTKGDFNPVPDPPISTDDVKYRVVLVLPLYLWLPALTAAFASAAIPVFPRRHPLAFEALVLVSFITVYSASAFFFASNPPTPVHPPKVPRIELVGIYPSGDYSTLTVAYRADGLSVTGVELCLAGATGSLAPCTARVVNATAVVVEVPRKVYERLYGQRGSAITLSLTLKLDKGRLLGDYTVPVAFTPPRILLANGSLVIENPNPVALGPFNVTVYPWEPFPPPPESFAVYAEPSSTRAVRLNSTGDVLVRVEYDFMGEHYVWAGKTGG